MICVTNNSVISYREVDGLQSDHSILAEASTPSRPVASEAPSRDNLIGMHNVGAKMGGQASLE